MAGKVGGEVGAIMNQKSGGGGASVLVTEKRIKAFPLSSGPDGKGQEVGDCLCGANAVFQR